MEVGAGPQGHTRMSKGAPYLVPRPLWCWAALSLDPTAGASLLGEGDGVGPESGGAGSKSLSHLPSL